VGHAPAACDAPYPRLRARGRSARVPRLPESGPATPVPPRQVRGRI